MAVLKNILLIIVAGLLLTSCKQYKYARYKPQTVQSEKKLLALFPTIPTDNINKSPWYLEIQNDEKKIHLDGLKNIAQDSGNVYNGYYSYKINNFNAQGGGGGTLILGIYTATFLFGVPAGNYKTDLDIDFLVYDAKKNLVAKYNVQVDKKKTKAWIGLYFSYSSKNALRVSRIKSHKVAFEKFSELVNKDIDAINAKLKSGGTVVIEKSDVIGNANDNEVYLNPGREINKEKGGGTGFLISENGYVVTNYHVVEDARKIELYFPTDSGSTKYTATMVSSDKVNDVAVLKIDSGYAAKGALPYTFSDEYNVSDEVFTIGYPQPDIMGAAYKYTKGEISSLSGIENNATMMQITTPIQPGNSGGPLFNKKGDVVGITTSTLNPFFIARYQGNIPQNVNYAVKSDYIKPLLKPYLSKQPNTIANVLLAEQIKILSKYVCMIRVY